MSNAGLRPGTAQGFYPERADRRAGWVDQAAYGIRGALARLWNQRPLQQHRFVHSVHRIGAALDGTSEAGIAKAVGSLRQLLVRQGLTDPVVAHAFALIREVAQRTLGTPHYDVQLEAGWAMVNGMLAEMETGEGKTLAATLPAATAALAGIPVHVISVNDYLVERDAEAMRPIYRALGLSVGTVTENLKGWEARRDAYACDITYVTGKLVAFDYLKDDAVTRLVDEVVRLTGESKTEAVRRSLEERKDRLAYRRASQDRHARLRRFLETEVWPRVPADALGRPLTKAEEEEVLGYGDSGV